MWVLIQSRHFGNALGVLKHRPRGGAAEATHTLGDIGGEADSRYLAVTTNIDARGDLPRDRRVHRAFHSSPENAGIDRLTAILGEQEFRQFRAPRQTANVGGQDVIATSEHGRYSSWFSKQSNAASLMRRGAACFIQ